VGCPRSLSVVYRHSVSSQQWSQLDPQPSCSRALVFFEEGLPLPGSRLLMDRQLFICCQVTFSHQETSASLTFNTPPTTEPLSYLTASPRQQKTQQLRPSMQASGGPTISGPDGWWPREKLSPSHKPPHAICSERSPWSEVHCSVHCLLSTRQSSAL
jgi:hypothetical protein